MSVALAYTGEVEGYSLPQIPLARVECRVLGPASRNARTWLGSALRGLIGDQLQSRAATCAASAAAFTQWYGAVHEPGAFASGHETRPYALRIVQSLVPGDRAGELAIRLTHFGHHSATLTAAAQALCAGLRGGKLKDMVALKLELRTEAPGGSGVFVDWDGCSDPEVGVPVIPERPFTHLRLRLLSALKLIQQDQLHTEPTPRDLIAATLRRISDLAARYGQPEPLPVQALLEAASALQWRRSQFEHVRAVRQSSTQQRVYAVDGVLGEAELDLSPALALWPLIAAIPYVQLGKATTMGFGAIRVEALPPPTALQT